MVGGICHPAFCTIRIFNPKIKKSALQPDMLLDYKSKEYKNWFRKPSEPVTSRYFQLLMRISGRTRGVFTEFYKLFNMKIEVIFSASLSPAQNVLYLFRVSGRHGNGLAKYFVRGLADLFHPTPYWQNQVNLSGTYRRICENRNQDWRKLFSEVK